MRYDGEVSRMLFYLGAKRAGYWTADDLVKQLKEQVIPLFEKLHPNCTGVFTFDQSSNHRTFASDALVASRMTLHPKEWNPSDHYRFKDTKFFHLTKGLVKQSFYEKKTRKERGHTVEYEEFKGIKVILEERDSWYEKDPNPERKGKKWRKDCGANIDIEPHSVEQPLTCCATHCLATHSDFLFQRSALQETLQRAKHLHDLYPKFHCECNWIERYWADVKRDVRANYDYTFKGLQQALPLALDRASPEGNPTTIRRYYQRCKHYIEAYAQGLDAWDAENQVN